MTTVERRLKDKVVFLSGATGGLGLATAERLAEEGAHLVLTDLDEQACKSLAADLAVFLRIPRGGPAVTGGWSFSSPESLVTCTP